MKKLRIAQIATLFEPVTDSSTMGLTQIVYNLTQELVALGHHVTLYAPAGIFNQRDACSSLRFHARFRDDSRQGFAGIRSVRRLAKF